MIHDWWIAHQFEYLADFIVSLACTIVAMLVFFNSKVICPDCNVRYIKHAQKRCRDCAVEFARGIDTDRFSQVVEEVESIMDPQPEQETTRVKFNPNKLQYIPQAEIQKALAAYRKGLWFRFGLGFLIAAIIFSLALWACLR